MYGLTQVLHNPAKESSVSDFQAVKKLCTAVVSLILGLYKRRTLPVFFSVARRRVKLEKKINAIVNVDRQCFEEWAYPCETAT